MANTPIIGPSRISCTDIIALVHAGVTTQRLLSSRSTHSVPSPNKLSVKGLGDRPGALCMAHYSLSYDPADIPLHGQVGAVYLLQSVSGARVSEVLNLLTSDILPPDQLVIRALKRSRSRLIRLPELREQFVKALSFDEGPLFSISYSTVYRSYKACGLISYTRTGFNNRVTHSLRRKHIQAVHSITKNIDTTRDAVGHKAQSSTQIYLNKGHDHG